MNNTQTAPYPQVLADIVDELEYRPDWAFTLEDRQMRDPGCEGLSFVVLAKGYNTYHPERGDTYRVRHFFPVPPATYNRESWMEWVRDRLIEIETHEACEWMRVGGKRPFAPNHGPGWNPYAVRTLNDVAAAETDFSGMRHEDTQ